MNIIRYPERSTWESLVQRPHLDLTQLYSTVASVLADVQKEGDKAVIRYEEKFDKVRPDSLTVTEQEIQEAVNEISPDLMKALELAHENIAKFHQAQKYEHPRIETSKGVECWQKSIPIEKVGLYIPGGTAPLFSTVLMLATPAKIAGCPEIILCSPPDRAGKIHPAILASAHIAGVSRIFKVGGIQAIGAMAYGTETIPKVYKIFGPGNQYVMAAKQQVSLQNTAIDMPAGPSEVCIIADENAHPDFVAADLLSQAEHGVDSQVMLISDSEEMLNKVNDEVKKQLVGLPRVEIATQTLLHSKLILVHNTKEAVDLSNAYAPEHLIIATKDYEQLSDSVINAGSVFLGLWSCESAGDYASGTNHTLPTHRAALAYNGVNLDSYFRKVTFQELTEDGIRSIGNAVVCMAENELLEAHANTMRLRLKHICKQM